MEKVWSKPITVHSELLTGNHIPHGYNRARKSGKMHMNREGKEYGAHVIKQISIILRLLMARSN